MALSPGSTFYAAIIPKSMNTTQPLVSVLITNYNYASYLGEAIDSALNQTYPNLEVIVVDDGSTDRSREIIASYQDRIIPVLQENHGQAAAVNAGFATSKGEIICFLDADDVWLPTKVEEVVKAIVSASNAAVVYHKIQNIDKEGSLMGLPWPPHPVIRGDISHKVAQTGGWWPWPPSTALSFTRTFLTQVLDIPEQEYRFFADAYPADLAPFFGNIVGLNQVLSYFRLHGANNWSNSARRDERNLTELEVRTKILNSVLLHKGINATVCLEHHLPYQEISYRLGKRQDLVLLSQLMLQNPWEPRLHSRLKAIAMLWMNHSMLLSRQIRSGEALTR